MDDRALARAAKEHLRQELAPLVGIGGIGIGRRGSSYVVTVDVTEQTACERVPPTVDGVTVEVRVVGQVRVLGGGKRPAGHPGRPGSEADQAPPDR